MKNKIIMFLLKYFLRLAYKHDVYLEDISYKKHLLMINWLNINISEWYFTLSGPSGNDITFHFRTSHDKLKFMMRWA